MKGGTNSKNGKGKSASSQGEESPLDCYTTRYMKAPYTLPNGLSIQVGHLWNKCMEDFHAVKPLLSAEKGKKHASSDPMDAFALSPLYMIKALNGQYAAARRQAMK
ncbi:hypothetical protein LIER_34604 [Lithospermum erythrorhizon]|uniref:Uncharacterized protein n=1 Tax=Lithospermum erythrorhizon TaxID=34254 RepID=A0AAV3S4C7_LITER